MAAILADDIFKCIFLNEKDRILIQISLKFVSRSQVDNEPAMVPRNIWAQATILYNEFYTMNLEISLFITVTS